MKTQEQSSQNGHSDNEDSNHESHSSMAMRGVTRPQMSGAMSHDGDEHESDENQKDGEKKSGGMMEMSHEDRVAMRQKHHEQTLWVPLTVVMLGVWLFSSAFTFGHQPLNPRVIEMTAGRGWFPLEMRGELMFWSDIIAALALITLGGIWAWTPRFPVVPWAACFVGIWLQFAPLLFWAPTAASYLNDTFVGAWIIALTILIAGMPPMIMIMKMGAQVPPGWSYNPSSWLQRAPLAATGFLGWLVSRYLAAYQLGYVDHIWDPFFDNGSVLVLTSKMSESLPISDGGLGAFAYTFEFLMAFMGGVARWRTMPWMVVFFGILVIPLGLTHIFLVSSQPVVVGHWCTMCIAAALIMLVMIPLSVDEVIAMGQFVLKKVRDDGEPFWQVFWKGGAVGEMDDKDERTPHYAASPGKTVPAMIWGVSAPLTLVASTCIGLWLLYTPTVFGTNSYLEGNDHLLGALTVTIAVIVMAEVLRAGRFLLTLIGAWLVVAPFVLSGSASTMDAISTVIAGLLLTALSIPRGAIRESYGGWERFIK